MTTSSTTSQGRKLAAILFADIQGYTAMMQSDEVSTMNRLKHYQSMLKKEVGKFNGEIIKNYGDGSLCIFSSVLDAVQCAKALQEVFRIEPIIPLRIGLHLGDVIFRENDIYGNALNIASRIESLGVAGSILMSKDVHKKVTNHPSLEFESLGKFEFKNVKDSIEVFALANPHFAVPKPSEISGKLKKKTTHNNTAKVLSTVAIVALLLSFVFYHLKFKSDQLPNEIRSARIAVLPFENNTNDDQLEVLGEMAADWITRNLTNLKEAKIVQFNNVKDHLSLLSATPSRFIHKTGAEQLIRGRYYKEGKDLIFETQIVDPNTSETIFAFPVIQGDEEKPSILIDDLSERISGYFAFQKDDLYSFSMAPKYEAFVAYQEGMKYYVKDFEKAKGNFEKAIAIDTNFLSAYIHLGGAYMNNRNFASADSIYKSTKNRFERLPRLERHSLEVALAITQGDIETEYHHMKEWLDIDPKPFGVNYQFAHVAQRFNKPEEVVKACQNIDLDSIKFEHPIENWWFEIYTDALISLDSMDQALQVINLVPKDVNPYYFTKQKIFTFQKKTDSLEQLIMDMEQDAVSENRILDIISATAVDFAVMGLQESHLKWAQKMLDRILNQPESAPVNRSKLAEAHYIKGEYSRALPEYEAILKNKGPSWMVLQRLGCIHANLGNRKKALDYIQRLEEKETQYSFGRYTYAQGLVYAALGDKEVALFHLKAAFSVGYGFNIWNYQYALESIPLQSYLPFKDFVAPKV